MDKKEEIARENRIVKKILKWSVISIFGFFLFLGSWYIVGAGERAVIVTLGNPSSVSQDSGLHFKLPLIQKAVKFDVKTQRYDAQQSAASSDLQTVNSIMATNYHLEPSAVPSIYREIGVDYQFRVIQPTEQEVVKATTAKYTAEELITKRELVREDIRNTLSERLRERGVIIEDVAIVNFSFSKSFDDAIEAKVTAEQNALAAKNKLSQIEYEAQQRVAQARGEAEAIQLQAETLKVQGGNQYIQLKALEIQAKAIDRWNGVLPQVSGNAIPFISLNQGIDNLTK